MQTLDGKALCQTRFAAPRLTLGSSTSHSPTFYRTHRRVLNEAKISHTEVAELKESLAAHSKTQARLEKELLAMRKEKTAVVEQLRAADRSGRQVLCVCVFVCTRSTLCLCSAVCSS